MACIDIEISDYLDELSTKDLMEELALRVRDGDPDAKEMDLSDWSRLADFIAEGQTADALALLARLSPATIIPATTQRLARLRSAAA